MKAFTVVSFSILIIFLPGCASNPVIVYDDLRPDSEFDKSDYSYVMGLHDGGVVAMESYSTGGKVVWFAYYLSMFAVGAVITSGITDNRAAISVGGFVSLAPAVYVTATWDRDLPKKLKERLKSRPEEYRNGFREGYNRATKELRVVGMLTFILEGVLGFEEVSDDP